MKEIWKPIVGFGKYSISNFGRVCSHKFSKPHILKHGSAGKNGAYRAALLFKKNVLHVRTIHRLVALHFLKLIPGKNQVHHIDHNKHNNRVDNLMFVTLQENRKYATEAGRMLRGTQIASAKLNTKKVRQIRELYKLGLGYRRLGRLYSVNAMSIKSIVKGITWRHVA